MAGIATATTKSQAFSNLGNLAFYDGWHPDYVYFKTLYNASVTFGLNKGPSPWDANTAGSIAKMAIEDAQAHANLNQMSEEDSTAYFLIKFKEITDFLKQAIAAEEASENAYLEEKIKSFKSISNRKDTTKINKLQELEDLLIDAKTGEEVPLDKINTLINVIQYGFKNARTLINYEQERVEKLTNLLNDFVIHRGKQVEGLGKKYKLPSDQIQQMRERAENRYKQSIMNEYVQTGHLTRKDKDKYVIWGAATIKEEIPLAMDRIFADWLNKTLDQVIKNETLVNDIKEKLDKEDKFPVNGDFRMLNDNVKETVIQTVIDYGIHNLSTVLSQDTSKNMMRRLKRQILKEEGLLDAVYSFDIVGTEHFGIMGTEPDLTKNVHSLAEMKEKSGQELYEKMKLLIEKEKSHIHRDSYNSDSYIVRALGQTTSTIDSKKSALSTVDDIMSLMQEIEELEKKFEQAKKAWIRSKKPIKEFKVNKNSKIQIVIDDESKEPKLDIIGTIKDDERLNAFNFKNKDKLKSNLASLKARASRILREEILSSLEQTNFRIPENQLIRHVREELRDLTIHINGPYLLEVLPTLSIKHISGNKAMVEWNNYKGKNDSIEILISTGKVQGHFEKSNFYQTRKDIFDPLKQQVEHAQQKLLKAYQENIDAHVKQMTEDNDYKKYSKMIEVMDTDEKKDEEETEALAAARKELKDTTKAYIAKIQEQYRMSGKTGDISDEEIIQLGEEYMDTLKNSFYVSTTTKSRNEYVNFIGLNGGTLGPTLDAQLARINDIFTSAGMKIEKNDYDWLRSAIINCFPGSIVGEKNKTLIESYIGSLAAFALFDEGAVEAHIVDNFKVDIVDAIRKNQAQKIVHLYLVDGIYVKGSTVLKRTLNTIEQEVIPNIQKIPQVMHRGAGVVIVNKITQDIIPNRPQKQFFGKGAVTLDANAWQTVGAKAQGAIDIKILFLAGLLDIIHSINATLSQVEH